MEAGRQGSARIMLPDPLAQLNTIQDLASWGFFQYLLRKKTNFILVKITLYESLIIIGNYPPPPPQKKKKPTRKAIIYSELSLDQCMGSKKVEFMMM